MAITPENRMEQILNGESITPENRAEYFIKEAIDNAGSSGSLPEPGTAGNVLTSNGTVWGSAAPPTVTIDDTITENGGNPVKGGAIYSALAAKADSTGVKNPLIVAGTVSGTVEAMTVTITDSLADIYAAAEAGRYVALEFSLGGGMFRLPLYGRQIENETIGLSFSKTILVGAPTLYTVEFEGAQTASVNAVELAISQP